MKGFRVVCFVAPMRRNPLHGSALRADAKFGASVFWIREGMLPEELMTDFFDVWQTGRDGKKSGMLELIDDTE
ncbi:MAG: hypothetical protein ACRERU_17805 [Methylococcales bacterium]